MVNNKNYRDSRRSGMSYRNYYVDGSAVRKTAQFPERTKTPGRTAAPGRTGRPDPQRRHAAQPVHHKQAVRNSEHADQKRRVNQRIAMRNREKAFKLDLRYTLFLCIAVIAALGSCVVYLSAQSAVSQKSSEIAALKSQLSTLTEANSVTRERINDAIDLEYVREYATEVLGMVYPTENQIITYQSSDDDFVKQYQDIPQSGE